MTIVSCEVLAIVDGSVGRVGALLGFVKIEELLKDDRLLPVLLKRILGWGRVTVMIFSLSARYLTKSSKLMRLPADCLFLLCFRNIKWNNTVGF